MLKLGVAIRVGPPFARLGVGLQAIAQLVQHRGHQALADAVALLAQFAGQLPQALAGPAQRRVRVAPAQEGLNQRL
jgi:hypothetical protein